MTKGEGNPPYELEELLQVADRNIEIKKGSYLFQEGQPAKEMYIILSGKVQISKMNAEGSELCLRLCQRNDIVGELTLFTQLPKYIFNAKVIEDGEVAAIRIPELEAAFFKNSKLAYEFLKWMNDHIRRTMTKFRDLVLHGKKGALYSTLIRLSNSYGIVKDDGIHITISLTNQDLANFCGTARESVSRMLTELRAKGIISITRKRFIIHDIHYLKDEIDCENCPVEYCNID
ncbi:Crp/Fnr family transcriptional regulator [Bacillus sp. FJAT-29790]|uniref:Crp/Fnr family transcriptional regulator n=1 Tax=Bacillus sp. FJAT-29790 TaxID=1895002 RepID=UPI001C226A94|nr:Crp/Fnr family transcriptional regulator [Bacillus sp. FJAT-29790]MBU8878368.1 Crp/Fnr family transcriptional regulator [Bacillus sp. FJAT-29790]